MGRGLGRVQTAIMLELLAWGRPYELRIGTIHFYVDAHDASISRAITRLVRRGYIWRDAKAKKIALTTQGLDYCLDQLEDVEVLPWYEI